MAQPTAGSAGLLPLHIRAPEPSDGASLWTLARESGLDENSPYAYLLWSAYFADTSVVADLDGVPVGFVTGFTVPARPDTVFVWQVGVAAAHRGHGIGSRLLDALVCRQPHVRFLEGTVTPANAASAALFRGFGSRHGGLVEERELFAAGMFPPGHDPEVLFRIGPFRVCDTT